MMEISKPTLYKYIDANLANVGKAVESKREQLTSSVPQGETVFLEY